MIYLYGFSSLLFAYVTRPLFINLLREGDLTQTNYQGKEIPVGMGLYIFFSLAVLWPVGYYLELFGLEDYLPLLLLVGIFSFLGFVDDLLGNRKARGFIGHFRCLLEGRLTTGGLKALGAATIGLVVVSYTVQGFLAGVVSWFTLLLMTNFINLLDVQPGRAIKFFSLAMIFLFFMSVLQNQLWILAIPIGASIIFYYPLDLGAEVMLGDVGANLLGGILGFYSIQLLGFWAEAVLLFTLILIHLYGERYSISTYMEKNRVLHWFDRWGRG